MATLKSRTAGFNLLEMLVALLVLSVGLLGVTSLQLKGQQTNHLSYVRTQVTYLAYDLMERIRANNNSKTGLYANVGECSTAVNQLSTLRNKCESNSSPCSWNEIAQYDLALWCDMVRKSLPEGTGECCQWDSTNLQYTFTIGWVEKVDEDPKVADWTIMIPDI